MIIRCSRDQDPAILAGMKLDGDVLARRFRVRGILPNDEPDEFRGRAGVGRGWLEPDPHVERFARVMWFCERKELTKRSIVFDLEIVEDLAITLAHGTSDLLECVVGFDGPIEKLRLVTHHCSTPGEEFTPEWYRILKRWSIRANVSP